VGGALPLLAAGLWALAVSATALLPMRRQIVPGLALLAAAPPLIWWLAAAYGPLAAAAGGLAVLSTFRRPLAALLRRLAGRAAGGERAG
jgi:hypothetical protein